MKKIAASFLFCLLFFAAGPLFSQENFPVKLGLRIAPNIGWMNPNTDGYSSDGASFGGTIGFMGDFYFAKNYAFTSGFNFLYINGKLNYSDSVRIGMPAQNVNGDVFRKYHFIYVEIPLMIKMKTNPFGKFSFYGQIGLGTGFRVKATAMEHFVPETGAEPVDNEYSYNTGTTLIREAILIGAGLEYNLDESSRIVIGLGYSNALNNVMTGVNYKSGLNEKSTLNYAELTIGFLF